MWTVLFTVGQLASEFPAAAGWSECCPLDESKGVSCAVSVAVNDVIDATRSEAHIFILMLLGSTRTSS